MPVPTKSLCIIERPSAEDSFNIVWQGPDFSVWLDALPTLDHAIERMAEYKCSSEYLSFSIAEALAKEDYWEDTRYTHPPYGGY